MEIYVSLNQGRCPNGSVFNITDGEAVSWATVWPGLCAYFGLEGTGPVVNSQSPPIEEFVTANKGVWDALVRRHRLKEGLLEAQNWKFVYVLMVLADFRREYSIEKAQSIGFQEAIPTARRYEIAFEQMAAAKVIPPRARPAACMDNGHAR